ncbi:hypothetical protein EYF80_009455 [Liparis tanakae]|uniref:Uncharacterized protein n=1 Tax=Liparis tanakae TaxID=230148 RepID=A0A4Z2IRH1_9TELE|nr:hypothetical protein EYF80_009455 [Liparis tanakae]
MDVKKEEDTMRNVLLKAYLQQVSYATVNHSLADRVKRSDTALLGYDDKHETYEFGKREQLLHNFPRRCPRFQTDRRWQFDRVRPATLVPVSSMRGCSPRRRNPEATSGGYRGNLLLGGTTEKTKFIRAYVRGDGISMATERYTHALDPWTTRGPGY